MPIKMNVSPHDSNQIYRAFDQLVAEMKQGGVTSGIIAAQSYNQMHWSIGPETGYKKHGTTIIKLDRVGKIEVTVTP